MAEREAAVKLTLDDAEYVVTMRKSGDEAEKAGRKGQKAMGLFGAGIKGAKGALSDLGGVAKKAVGLLGGLAAGFSVGTALQGAVLLNTRYKELAYSLSVANQKTVTAAEVQGLVEKAAGKSGRRAGELAEAFDQLNEATGDMGFSADVLESIGTTATATGKPIDTLVKLADQLHTKFGVSAAAMQDTFAQVFEASKHGGPSFEEFADVAGSVGAELLAAGMDGKKGLDFMLGSLVATDDAMKSLPAQVKGIKAVLRGLGDKGELKKIAEGLGIDPGKLVHEKDAMARLHKIFSFGQKGVKALMGAMAEGEEKTTLKVLFTDPFEKALAEANQSGLKGRKAIDAALGVLDKGIDQFGKQTITGADLQKQAAERMQDPQKRLEMALEHLQQSFAQPEIIDAIGELSKYLPQLATVFADLVKFAVKNPLLSGALGIGGTAGGGFLKSFAGELASARAKEWGSFISANATAADAFASKIGEAHKLGGMAVGNALRGAAALAGIAMAAEIGKALIEAKAAEDAKTTSDLSVSSARAGHMGGNLAREKAELAGLRQSLSAARESRSGIGGVAEDVFSGVGGLLTGTTGAASLKDAQIQEAMRLVGEKQAHIRELEAAGGASDSKTTVAIDAKSHKESGKAFAQALAQQTIKVEVVGGGAALRGTSGGGSRGPRSPAPAAPGGGY